ncbi:alpha-ketoglutarate-dependent dioxygenase AlkB [Streptomyces sp. NPDC101150]|uniref:alpha-ketoglutarate-dependent dioxygenase AlkB n=1 Tax=Streptomyces sp. NPDC101150 TaxID=3366114 RepID=UPI0037FA0A18
MLHEDGALFGRPSVNVAPGAILIPGWLNQEVQQELVTCSRQWAMGPAGMRRPRMPDGSLMHLRSVCLGWHWKPYRYSRIADDVDGARVRPMPHRIASLARAAVLDAIQLDPAVSRTPEEFAPDAAIINFYDDDDRLGMHQDRAEDNSAPVVTLSLGDSCIFRFGNPEGRTKPWRDLVLQSGDLFAFGGPSRFAYHGVRRTLPGTSPTDLDIRRGRVSVTVRETGLSKHSN